MKVILQKDLFDRSKKTFQDASHKLGIKFLVTDILDEATMIEYNHEGACCIVIGSEKYSREFYNTITEGSFVIRYGVGYNAVPIDICKTRNIMVGYTPGSLTDSVAEHTMALLLSMVRHIPLLDNRMKEKQWQGETGFELRDKTMAILGFGQIGKAVARIAKYGFGMKIHAFDIIKPDCMELINFYSDNYNDVVRNADIITVHLPSITDTIGFIDSNKIEHMKPGVILINTARGDVVVEKDLYNALINGQISSAGLDVFQNEPYFSDADFDFRKLKNVILTPHCGSNTTDANEKMANMVIQNIMSFYTQGKMILIPEMHKNA
jgi:phosphoglycerate dehydrogenase-like enzyme